MEQKRKIRLDEVTLMRTILAFLIVFMHSFTCYNGSWDQPAGYVDIPLYRWFQRVSFAFTLEAFVFISGYLFAFQRITLKRVERCTKLITSKLKRLILPSVIFSSLYFAVFCKYKGLANLVWSLINGCGHMWFLPMLFWCYLGCWLLIKVKIKDCWKIVLLVFLNLFTFVSLPLRLSEMFVFMIYFYGGYCFYKHLDRIRLLIKDKHLIWFWVIFVVLFIVLRPLRDYLIPESSTSLIKKTFMLLGNHACQLLYAWSGLIAFYFTSVYYITHYQLSEFTKKLAACCFGVYLFQQFVLEFLYYNTEFPLVVGPYWLPWCGFIIALLASIILSSILLKTKLGRNLIG